MKGKSWMARLFLPLLLLATPCAAAESSPQPTSEQMDSLNPYIQKGLVQGYAHPWQLGFQDAGSPVFEKLKDIHDYMLLPIIVAITLVVLGLLVYVCIRFSAKNNPVPSRTTHNTLIEVIWTVIPIIILVAIAIPSLRSHYYMTNVKDPGLTLKVTGFQWYWGYDLLDANGKSLAAYESHMVPVDQIHPEKGQIRMLSVDKPIVVPVGTTVRVLETGNDVIHSWAVPAFGVKTDAVPGRLNETWFRAEKTGIYYGECSELCGVYHGFMPIEIHVVEKPVFEQWAANAKAGNLAIDGLSVAATAPVTPVAMVASAVASDAPMAESEGSANDPTLAALKAPAPAPATVQASNVPAVAPAAAPAAKQ